MSGSPDCTVPCEWREAANHNERAAGTGIELLVLHYTGMQSEEGALDWLCCEESRVSCHYFVFSDGRIVQSVPESRRAWHAGVSSWRGLDDLNSRSIGIEIANPGHEFGYVPFPEAQIEAVIALARDIVVRNAIKPRDVVAHSDIAPARKQDPGELFPWKRLAQHGVGIWAEANAFPGGASLGPGDDGPAVSALRQALAAVGYGVSPDGAFDDALTQVVIAFQRRFRQQRVDGLADVSTIETLQALLAAEREASLS